MSRHIKSVGKTKSKVFIEIIEVARLWKEMNKQCQSHKSVSANVEVNHSHDTEAPKASTQKALSSKLPSRWIYARGLIKNMGWNGIGTSILYFLKLKSRFTTLIFTWIVLFCQQNKNLRRQNHLKNAIKHMNASFISHFKSDFMFWSYSATINCWTENTS